MKHLTQAALSLSVTLVACAPAHAELWPTLEDYVSRCVLIVKATTVSEGADKPLTFTVLESWKGQYHPNLLKHTKPDGRFIEYQGHHGINVVDGQEIVFFFTRHNNPPKGPLSSHNTAFPVKDGKIVYASTNDHLRKEYTLEEFKKRVKELVKMEKEENRNSEQQPEPYR